MKFLGIRNGHDCNITYTDGKKVRYAKLERNLQIKHYHWMYNEADVKSGKYSTPESREDMASILDFAKKTFNIDLKDLDAICIDPSPDRHPIKNGLDIYQTHKELDKKSNPFWSEFSCPIYLLGHHQAHVYSCWPLADVASIKNHFVIDGEGDFNRSTTIFKNGKVVDYSDYNEHAGMSKVLEMIGIQYGMHGMKLDVSGKTMALKSFHKVSDEQLNQLLTITSHMSYRHFKSFVDLSNHFLNQVVRAADEKEHLVNLLYLIHVFGEQKVPEFFSNYMDGKLDNLCTYSGGTAQNTCINTEIRNVLPNIIIPPHCPDDGISLGCVEFLRQQYSQEPFDNSGFPYWQSDEAPESEPSAATIDKTAEYLAQGKIVAWYQGNGELGPRALGNRSILMDPSIKDGKDTINSKVKKREPYRPFGASILYEEVGKHFTKDWYTPYMLYVVDFKTNDFPAVSHIDNTCRHQTVKHEPQTKYYYELIDSFYKKTGIPMVLNTSLNVDGRPIAGHVADAKELFDKSELDVLVVGDEIIVK